MVNYHYRIGIKVNKWIPSVVDSVKQMDNNSFFSMMALVGFIKTDFERVDKHFKEFTSSFQMNMFSLHGFVEDYELFLIDDAFSELLLNNIGSSTLSCSMRKKSKSIKSKLQAKLYLYGFNFILLPNVLVKCADIQFKFK
jgi:hypothetical protein